MKKIIFFLLLCILANLNAQQLLILQTSNNSLRAGDNIIKQQVEYKDPGSNGKNLHWDFRHLQPIDYEYRIRYFIPDSIQMSQICGMEHNTRYYYEQQNDSVWAVGYENATTYMQYIQPELRMRYPFQYGDTLYSRFIGKGEYGKRLKLKVEGYTRIEADAEGELLLPDSEQIKKALRVRTLRHYTESGKDSVEMELDTYTWYASGMHYPVFESVKTTIMKRIKANNPSTKDTVIFTTSFYYPPIDQEKQIEEEETTTQPFEINYPESIEDVFTEAQLLPNPVTDYLYIHFKLTREANVSFTIHSQAGISMAQTPTQRLSAGYHTIPLNMSSYMSGVYTLYIKVDEMILSLNAVKK